MTNTVFCAKLQKQAPALEQPPYPGEIGQKIYNYVSQPAWQMWLEHQTTLINEYRLNLADPKSQSFLMQEMEKFFFGEGSAKPEGYQLPES